MTKFTTEQLQTLLQQGLSQAQAARQLGVDPAAVCIRLRRLSLPPKPSRDRTDPGVIARALAAYLTRDPGKSPVRGKFTDSQVHTLLLAGQNLSGIARQLGVSVPAIRARISLWEGCERDRTGPPVKKAEEETEEHYASRLAAVRARNRQSYRKWSAKPTNKLKVRMSERKRLGRAEARAKRNNSARAYYGRNVKRFMDYRRGRYRTNPEFRLAESLRSRLAHAFQSARMPRPGRKENLTGCSPAELLQHIAGRFQSGMTLENYGEWVIDHTVPVCAFDLACPLQRVLCFHVSNLNPLWKKDNLRKISSDLLYAEQVRATRGGLWTCPVNFPNPSSMVAPRALQTSKPS